MIFKLYNSDVGLKYNSVFYQFTHVDSVVLEDPQTTKLVRGANAGNKTGLVYQEGIKDAKKLTIDLFGLSESEFNMFETVFNTKARVEVSVIDRDTGSSKIAKEAILTMQPRQMTLDETPDSMKVSLVFETFHFVESHKDS